MEAQTLPLVDLIREIVPCKEECDHPTCEYLHKTQEITREHGLGFTTQEQYGDLMTGAATHLLHRLHAGYSIRV